MAAKRSNARTLQTVYRTYRLPPQVRKDMGAKRKQFDLTVAEFLSQAISHELPRIASDLKNVGLPTMTPKDARPARLPLSDDLLKTLKSASGTTGVPASRLLVACLNRATRRKRQWTKRG
jgi:hypothetical protein